MQILPWNSFTQIGWPHSTSSYRAVHVDDEQNDHTWTSGYTSSAIADSNTLLAWILSKGSIMENYVED